MGELSLEHGILFRGEMVRAILAGTKTQTRRLITTRNTWFDGSPWPKWHKDATWDWGGAWVDGGPSPANNPGPYLHLPFVSHTDPEVQRWWERTSHRIYSRVRPGDRLWVKESWAYRLDMDHLTGTELVDAGVRQAWYWADGPGRCCNTGCNGAAGRVRSARFMPRWASRITLPVVSLRLERLQQISEADAMAEGADPVHMKPGGDEGNPSDGWISYKEGFRRLWDSINAKRSTWAHNPWVLVYEWEPFHG